MFEYYRKLIQNPHLLTSYNTGLLQTKAYRVLKMRTTELLKPYQLSTPEWAALGTLKDATSGLRSLELAQTLGVEQPFITVMASNLHARGLVAIGSDPADKRVKQLQLTAKGVQLVTEVEKVLRAGIKPILKKASTRDLIGYLKVLEVITNYDEERKE